MIESVTETVRASAKSRKHVTRIALSSCQGRMCPPEATNNVSTAGMPREMRLVNFGIGCSCRK
jgi:hypothetical protein